MVQNCKLLLHVSKVQGKYVHGTFSVSMCLMRDLINHEFVIYAIYSNVYTIDAVKRFVHFLNRFLFLYLLNFNKPFVLKVCLDHDYWHTMSVSNWYPIHNLMNSEIVMLI